MTTLFISDLHLQGERPDITTQFLSFLRAEANDAEALYILGDLFEAWIGDDNPDAEYARVKTALADLAVGTPVYFMHGNRDFLVGNQFAEQTRCTLLPDPSEVALYGRRVLLMHGDTLCTDDIEYQAFRKQVRDPDWQQQFLAMDLDQRAEFARRARDASREHGASKPMEIMDVNADAVTGVMREHEIDLLIHGHTHRPNVHTLDLDGRPATRIVLGDWYTQGSVLRFNADGFELSTLPR